MKKFIIFIALFAFICADTLKEYKCPDEKSKAKVCAIDHYREGTSDYDKYIKKTCKNGETCSLPIADNAYVCENARPSKYLIKYGGKCNYNEDCLSGHCEGDKCVPNKGCEDCDKEETCTEKVGASTYECKKYLGDGEEIKSDDFYYSCAPGYSSNYVLPTSKCIKLFSLENDESCTYSYLCKSGICNEGQCVTIDEDADCENNKLGTDSKGHDLPECETLFDKKVSTYTKKRMEYFKNKVYDRFDKLKLDKLSKKKYNDFCNLPYNAYYKHETIGSGPDAFNRTFLFQHGDKKLNEYLTIFNNWNELYVNGLIDDEGKKNKDKKCEYKFVMREKLASTILKSCLVNTLVILAFLL